MKSLIFVIACIPLAKAATAQPPDQPAAKAPQTDSVAKLVDQLVLSDVDTYVKGTQTYLAPTATKRINRATERLITMGKDAWPVLFQHLPDKRPSIASESVAGPHQVGHKCHYILRCQIVSYPKGYPNSLLSAASDLHQLFEPSLQKWLQKRSDRSLLEIQMETLRYVIDLETKAAKQNGGWKTVEKLNAHLQSLIEKASDSSHTPRK